MDKHNTLTKEKRIQLIIIVGIGTFMGALDSSIVNISLPSISNYFNISLTTVEWVVLSYLIVISSLLLAYGRLGDLYGHKRIYLIGFIIFTIGSLSCALSPTILILILSRALQAVGAGMLMSMGSAIITINTPSKDRGKYLGFNAIAVSVALSAGPVIGGFLTSYFGWQSIFFINIPIGIIGFFWAMAILPFTRGDESLPFDFMGAIFLFLGLVGIIFPLSLIETLGWKNITTISSLLAGIIFLVIFFILEKKIKHPMLDLSLFKNRLFFMSNLALLLNYMSQFTVTFILPFYLIQLRNLPPGKAGLILIANPIVVMIIAPIAGCISDRIDSRYISSSGMVFTSLGLFLLSTLKADTNVFLIIIFLAIIGFGIGIFQTPNNSAIMGAVPHNRRGIASSMIATMRNLGMVFGVALSGTLFSSRQIYLKKILSQKGLGGIELNNQAFIGSLKFTFIVGSLLAATAIFISLIRGPLNNKAKK